MTSLTSESNTTSSPAVGEPPENEASLRTFFDDTHYTYQEESSSDLKKKRRILGVLRSKQRVATHKWLFGKFRRSLLLRRSLPESTFFDYFLGEDDLDESLTLMGWLKDRDVTVVPSFSQDIGGGEDAVVVAYGEIKQSFKFADEHRNLISFLLLKPKLLVEDSVFIKYALYPATLTEEEQEEIERFHSRFLSLCRLAYDYDLPVVVEADSFLCQPIIDRYTDEAMLLYNRHKPIVYAGVELYHRDRLQRIEALAKTAREEGLYVGIALFEGLFYEEERSYASKRGYPLLPFIPHQEREALYSQAIAKVFEHSSQLSLCAFTHSERHCQEITHSMASLGRTTDEVSVHFVQMMGLADSLSFALSRAGFNVSKLFPYGEPSESLHNYLRRFHSNRACRQLASSELQMVARELHLRQREKR